jgi:hypothetical protein
VPAVLPKLEVQPQIPAIPGVTAQLRAACIVGGGQACIFVQTQLPLVVLNSEHRPCLLSCLCDTCCALWAVAELREHL